ncbi:MAG: DUF6596 domain-containing protein [Myxococcota bacterium]
MPASAHDRLEAVLKEHRARILSSLIRTCGGDFDLAEETLHDAVVAAATQWPQQGTPDAPDAWLLQTARHKAIDVLRANARKRAKHEELGRLRHLGAHGDREVHAASIPDDMLRLIFTCCHPALREEARLALTLRTVVGLPTAEIARAFLVSEQTMAQRLVRAKKKIREARIPYRVPERSEMPERLEAVLLVVYLVFNEGYSASSGKHVVRGELCRHAIHVGRVLSELMPEEPEVLGLLSLMLLQDSRREARTNDDGDLVLLHQQDRSRWDRAQIEEGLAQCRAAHRVGAAGAYTIQAAIAAVHAQAKRADDTDWKTIVRLYARLLLARPTPVVALNHAVASAMAHGAEEGLRLTKVLQPDLELYGPFHAARADFLRTTEQWEAAEAAYLRAIALSTHDPERRFLEGRLAEVREQRDR